MSKKLAAKASLIQLPAAAAPVPSPAAAAPPPEPRARTAPGTMAHFLASQSSAAAELDGLREKARAFEGALPARPLDARKVRASRWANRHEASFTEPAFLALKADIAASGGNVQPIKVRPAPTPGEFEIVYGHRRHRACLELALPVTAVIETVDDRSLFEAMERENRGRKSLSAWEQGMMYRRALDDGLYPSQRRLAEALGVDVSQVSKSLALARLPEAVVAAFTSPLDIQFRWAQPLSDALQKDPEGLVGRAAALAATRGQRTARQTLDRLLSAGEPALNRSTPPADERVGRPGRGASVHTDRQGAVHVRFDPGALSPERQHALRNWLDRWLAED